MAVLAPPAALVLAELQIHESGHQEGEPKQMYCERLNDTAVCAGVYSF
jgi:hypothetical protein